MSDAFADILGQERVIGRLRAGMAKDRLPHGLLFAGPMGVGKGTTALALAKAFLSGGAKAAGATAVAGGGSEGGGGESMESLARRVDAGGHPDVHIVTRQLVRVHDRTGKSKALRLSVEVIREELVRPAAHHSVEGRGKVFIVEEAETMTTGAQNALLKTLEEPAGRALIVLLTHQPGSLLATIRSRCQPYVFGELSREQALEVLGRRGVSGIEAERSVEIAGGSPGRATRFIEDGVVERAGELFGLVERSMTGGGRGGGGGGGGGGGLAAWFKEAAEAYATKQLERDPLGSKDAFTREGMVLYLSLAAEHLRRKLPEIGEERMEEMCGRIDAVARAEKYLSANVNAALTFQQLELALRG